jgi:cell division protein FtsW (lipid II flippase)
MVSEWGLIVLAYTAIGALFLYARNSPKRQMKEPVPTKRLVLWVAAEVVITVTGVLLLVVIPDSVTDVLGFAVFGGILASSLVMWQLNSRRKQESGSRPN